MPVPARARRTLAWYVTGLRSAAVPWPRKGLLQLCLDHALDEIPDLTAHSRFDRIEPIRKKLGVRLSSRMRQRKLRGSAFHGEPFGWLKTVGGFRKTRHRGRDLVEWFFVLTATAYNLIRIPTILAAAG
jgi:hypothetical protein